MGRKRSKKTKFPIFGRHVLQAIGCDNKFMLSAACDKNDRIINIPDALAQDANSLDGGLIAALLEDAMGTYHGHSGEETDALDDSDVYIDFGDDLEKELDAALEKSVLDAEKDGLSEQGVEELRRVLQERRSVFCLRLGNTVKQSWPMPHLHSKMRDFADRSCFAIIVFSSGYWQMPVHPDSYGTCGIVCPNGTYSSTRALPGLTNASAYSESTVEPLFQELRANMKAWLDDFKLHRKDERQLLRVLACFLSISQEKHLFLSARKCRFFSKEINWCGRVVNDDGQKKGIQGA